MANNTGDSRQYLIPLGHRVSDDIAVSMTPKIPALDELIAASEIATSSIMKGKKGRIPRRRRHR